MVVDRPSQGDPSRQWLVFHVEQSAGPGRCSGGHSVGCLTDGRGKGRIGRRPSQRIRTTIPDGGLDGPYSSGNGRWVRAGALSRIFQFGHRPSGLWLMKGEKVPRTYPCGCGRGTEEDFGTWQTSMTSKTSVA